MDASYQDWLEIHRILGQLYPDVPLHEAHAKVFKDAGIVIPQEAWEVIKSVPKRFEGYGPEFLDALSDLILHGRAFKLKRLAIKIIFKIPPDSGEFNLETIASGVGAIGENTAALKSSVDGIRVIGQSMLDRQEYYGRWTMGIQASIAAQMFQALQILRRMDKSLQIIAENTSDMNNLTAQGGGGPDGFAKAVLDYVKSKISNAVKKDPKKGHRFFLYHPATDWIPTFERLIRSNPLPPSFCALFHDLDAACIYLQDIREQLNNDGESGRDVILHLLIPSWSNVSIMQPLHFPDALQPFRIHGSLNRGGKPYVTFNLPAAPPNILDEVGNIVDPDGWNTTAGICSKATGLVAGTVFNFGSLGMGLTAASTLGLAASALAPVIFVPIWFGGVVTSIEYVVVPAALKVHDSLRDGPPRILGSNDYLDMGYRPK